MKKTITKTETIETTPEVDEFLEAQERWFQWQRLYPKAYQELVAIAPDYNATLDAAEKVLRAHGKSEGPFGITSSRQDYDADKLYDEVGKEAFIELGGQIETKLSFSIDKTVLKSKIAANKVDAEVVEAISKTVHVYGNKPKKLQLA